MPPHDKRVSARYQVEIDMQVVRDGQASTAVTVNLSLGGALVRVSTEPPLKVGDRVEIAFHLPDLAQPLTAKADVRWLGHLEEGLTGLQFATGFRAKETWALGRFLERQQPA